MTAQRKKTARTVPSYTKKALLESSMFTPVEKSILKLSLEDDKAYTMTEVNKAITEYKKGI